MVTDDKKIIKDILKKYSKMLPELIDSDAKAPMISEEMQKYIKEISGVDDPYAEELLFIADNTGEAVFDKLLIKKIKEDYNLKITYAVRETAILNDITAEGAKELGIDDYAEIIKSGSRAPAMLMESASNQFLKHYQNADLVISKGQGNLEGLYGIESEIYFLLKAKCEVIAEVLEVKKGDFVFIYR